MKTAEDILKEKNREMICVSPLVTVYEAVQIMVKHKIGAIVIKENDKIVGIFTERDLLNNVANKDFDPKKALIKDYMQTKLISVLSSDPIYKLQDKILGAFLRHLIVEKDEQYIGLISAGDVARADLLEKEQHLSAVSWDYYEDWHWGKKK